MAVMPDTWIRKMAKENGMIDPFVDGLQKKGVISYGVSGSVVILSSCMYYMLGNLCNS